MTVQQPSDEAVLNTLFDIRIGNPHVGLENVHKIIKSKEPQWVLSIKVQITKPSMPFSNRNIKRLRRLQNLHGLQALEGECPRLPYKLPWRCNCAVVRCGISDSMAQDPSEVMKFCESDYIPSIGDTSSFDKHAKLLLKSEEVEAIGKAYERKPSTIDWYFEIFCGKDVPTNQPRNWLVEPLVSRRHGPVRGDILLVKNGPANGDWCPEFTLADVADILWWYNKSGRDVTEVFGEREMARFLTSL